MSKHFVDRLERMDYLIRTKATGTPAELADKLNISRRSVYDYINLLKEMGAPIAFCRKRKSFYYEAEGHFQFKFLDK